MWGNAAPVQYSRAGQSSWEVEEGIILLGGFYSGTTSEIAKWDGTTEEMFSMRYDTRYYNDLLG